MKIISFLIIIILLVLGVSFAIINAEPVTLHYYLGTHPFPLSFIIVSSFGLGFLGGCLILSVAALRLKSRTYQLKKRLNLAEQEIENLRKIPIQDDA